MLYFTFGGHSPTIITIKSTPFQLTNPIPNASKIKAPVPNTKRPTPKRKKTMEHPPPDEHVFPIENGGFSNDYVGFQRCNFPFIHQTQTIQTQKGSSRGPGRHHSKNPRPPPNFQLKKTSRQRGERAGEYYSLAGFLSFVNPNFLHRRPARLSSGRRVVGWPPLEGAVDTSKGMFLKPCKSWG